MKLFRSAISFSLSLALAFVAPGLAPFEALAAVRTASVSGSGAPKALPAPRLGSERAGIAGLDLTVPIASPRAAELPVPGQVPAAGLPSAAAARAGAPAGVVASRGPASADGVVRSDRFRPRSSVALLSRMNGRSARAFSAQEYAFDGRGAARAQDSEPAVLARAESLGARLRVGGAAAAAKSFSVPVPAPPSDILVKASLAAAFGGAALAFAGVASLPAFVLGYVGIALPSLILHEMGHGWAAYFLGDDSPRKEGRMSFRPKDLWNHVNAPAEIGPISIPLGLTFVVPLLTFVLAGVIFGGARPVVVFSERLSNPVRDMALVALAGPAVNFVLALIGGVFFGLAAAAGATALSAVFQIVVWLNVMLGVFNLLPFAPLDGHHVVRYLLRAFGLSSVSYALDNLGSLQFFALIFLLMRVPGLLSFPVGVVEGFILNGGQEIASFVFGLVAR